MTDIKEALVELAKLISLFDESGTLDFEWFGDPLVKGVDGLAERRDHFGKLIQALAGKDPGASPTYDAKHVWETLLGEPVELGFAWTKPEHPLALGFGAKAGFTVAQQQLAIGALIGLLRVSQNGQHAQLDHDLGRIGFSGQLPVPPFLTAAQVGGEVLATNIGQSQLTLGVSDPTGSCTLTPIQHSSTLHWDFARQGIFVICAWLRNEGTKPAANEVVARLAKHLLPLFVGGETIKPFPLFDGHVPDRLGKEPNFGPWAESMMAGNGAGAMTALWHLRALVTGNEDKSLFGGSCFIPLHELPNAPGTIDQQGLLAGVSSMVLPNLSANPAPGVYLGAIWDNPPSEFKLVLRVIGNGGDASVEILRVAKGQNNAWSVSATEPTFNTFASVVNAGLPSSAAPYIKVVGQDASHIEFALGEGLLDFASPFDSATWALSVRVKVLSAPRVELVLGLGPKGGSPLVQITLGGTPPVDVVAPRPSAVLALLGPVTHATIVAAIGELFDDMLPSWSAPPKAPSHEVLLAMLHAAAATNQLKFDIGPLAVGLESVTNKLALTVNLKITGLEPDDSLPITIGGVEIGMTLALTPTVDIEAISFGLLDMRMGELGLGGTIGKMLPDLREAPGFDLKLGGSSSGITLAGKGAIPIQTTIGPFELSTLRFEFDNASLEVGVDGQFSLGGVVIAPYGLGVTIPFKANGKFGLHLDGLGLSFDASGLTMTGMFAKVNDDFLGAAVLGVFDLFELSAIGGYTDIKDGKGGSTPSLFVFASLEAPLGGPPYLFITGLAGGFGFNRRLAKVTRVSDHPLLKVMKGQAIDTKDMIGSLTKLGEQFLPELGEWWIAAGVQFTSFGFIAGKLLAVLAVGKSFRFELIGSAAFGIDPIAYFEIDFGAFIDAESFLVRADISPNSYLIHPDIFSLHGSFALGVWYGGEHAGDFVFSIGGFHPYYPVPAHYPPDLDRVSVKAVVFGWVHFEVSAYFALTPRALMAGAAISLWAEFAGISAGLDVWVDVLIQWDPFFIYGRMGVAVWFVFLGRHEISVSLELWTPELGGIATIDLAIVSFDIEFGAALSYPSLKFFQFVDSQLGIPAKAKAGGGAVVSTFAVDDEPGLLKLDVLWGRSVVLEREDEGQEGLDPKQPIKIGPEFGLVLRSRIPAGPATDSVQVNGHTISIKGELDFPLCNLSDRDSTLTFNIPGAGQSVVARQPVIRSFPAAQFGDDFEGAQADSSNARQVAAEEGNKEVRFLGVEGIALHFHPKKLPVNDWVIQSTEEPSTDEERYPLPLDTVAAGKGLSPKRWSQLGALRKTLLGHTSRLASVRALDSITAGLAKVGASTKSSTPKVWMVELPRALRPTRVAGKLAATAERVPVPTSPVRLAALAVVEIEIIEPTRAQSERVARHTRGNIRLDRMQLSSSAARTQVAKLSGKALLDIQRAGVAVAAGKVVLLEPPGGRLRGRVVVSGNQTVRVVFVSRFGRPVGDAFVSGNGQLAIPRGADSLLIFGEGNDAPALGHPAVAREVVGVDQDSVLTTIGSRSFAARGCTIVGNGLLRARPAVLDVIAGRELLRCSTHVTLSFPALPADASAIVLVRARSATPAAIEDQLAWASVDAKLRPAESVVQPGRLALVFNVEAPTPWTFEAEVQSDWEFLGIAACPRSVAASLAALDADPTWDLVDDRWTSVRDATSTIRLELSQ